MLKSDVSMWFTLPDVIGSKFMTGGEVPQIEQAISFRPEGIQDGLKDIEILKGIKCNVDEDFIKKLIEERIRIKREIKTPTHEGLIFADQDLKQNILKIIANSTAYGIFIEVNPKDSKGENITMYGLDTFEYPVTRVEIEGAAFNPLIATFQTAGSRLILAMAEAKVQELGGKFAYCDTDSIFISPEIVPKIQEYFRPLNPYDENVEMFKIEDDAIEEDNAEEELDNEENDDGPVKKGRPLVNVKFLGKSSKRYALFDYNETTKEITLRKYSAHGLGHILFKGKKRDWLKRIWTDIIRIHYNPDLREEILDSYEGVYAITRLTISKYSVLERLKKVNEGKPLSERIKPYNFILVGTGYKVREGSDIKVLPMIPYVSPDSPEFDEIPFMSFTDLRTGDHYKNSEHPDTHLYWKPFTEVLKEYMNHKEVKMEGETELQRRHITFSEKDIYYIGKESNDLEEYMKLGVPREAVQTFLNLGKLIMTLDPKKDAEKMGIPERTIYHHQQTIRALEKQKKKFRPSSLHKEVRDAYIQYFS